MRLLLIAVALSLAPAAHAVPVSQTSPMPSCLYTCPQMDNGEFTNDGTSYNLDYTRLTCSYTGIRYQDYQYNYCIYDLTNKGSLLTDSDDGYCPTSATTPLGCSKRRAVTRASLPAPPQPALRRKEIASFMRQREELGQRKALQREELEDRGAPF